ncbi:sigma-54-dependent transcriptional regulator [Sporomusa malonica]|uniref:DNA-binding transcriptional response regulator, NtrC family, contains REC, AAA-type ATPase, and a Fis-type DNA-binding domains n=1 Tax=Sporomusa malonica TaxID=112901 RepID=A0A1W2C2E7_9FIRM|nr:sigma-54 dependent transcriptional regulator [Sporomusa malonica]SMC79417.1 DNA-binding transcriptional response regulator, NtrC family, contains REC, AAA-type ATPase, and a Fis-type DNA-binding domains [Sporomusa malonica]
MHKLLLVDDEPAICTSLTFALEDKYLVSTAGSAQEALAAIAKQEFNIVLLDLKLGSADGMEVLTQIKEFDSSIIVIIMTAYGSIKSSVAAIKAGAFYYLTKPINMDELDMLLTNASDYIGMRSKVEYLNDKLTERHEIAGMVGTSAPMRQILHDIDRVKDVDSNVLISGESGTGKELVAKALHYLSVRKHEAFEVLNCAAIPAELLESELFGHEKGAFTGAVQRKKGIFELADKGTLFLDEIGEMDIKLQAKLLRVVQEKEVTPIGSGYRRKIDVRIICATNRDLKKMVADGKFREDLYFRLNVVTIHLPPLRQRREDIPLLTEHFVNKYNKKMAKQIKGIETGFLEVLSRYEFKGNVRELENIIERAMVFAEEGMLQVINLPVEVQASGMDELNQTDTTRLIPIYIGEDLDLIERKVITKTLHHYHGDKAKTAHILKISERKLWYKIKEYELR